MEERMKMILSVIFFFVLSFPIWWYSTSVYQKELPHEEISTFKNKQKNLQVELHVFSTQEVLQILPNVNKNYGKYETIFKNKQISTQEVSEKLKKFQRKEFDKKTSKRGVYEVYILKSDKNELLFGNERIIYSKIKQVNQGKKIQKKLNFTRQFRKFIWRYL
jgi:hypothetical protein